MLKRKSTTKRIKTTVYQIDQSGKLEYTSHDTVVAISNGESFTVTIKAKEKRLLQKMYRTSFHKSRQYLYEVFSALLFILITTIKSDSQFIIDKEYPGKESLIKLHILEYDRSTQKISAENINFELIGKRSPAHNLAYTTFKKKISPTRVVTAEEIIEIIFPLKKTGYSAINGTEGS